MENEMITSRHSGAFDGDGFIEAELRRLVGEHHIRTIVETGTYRGDSTRALCEMAPDVVTIEIAPPAGGMWSHPRVRQFLGDSGKVLRDLVPALKGPILFYLDAHWGEHSPLLEELEAICVADLLEAPVIAIHDFENPFHPEYGFDTWDIGPYRLELVRESLEGIYGEGGYRHWYNLEAAGRKRGIIYIEGR